MPDRIIRDELLTSEPYAGLPDNAYRCAYVACLLTADTLGNMEAGDKQLIRLWRDYGIDEPAKVQACINALDGETLETSLAKPYTHSGKRYLHIPRFGQQRRYIGRLCPLSPWTTNEDNQALKINSRSAHPVHTQSAPSAHVAPTESALVGVKGVEVKGKGLKGGERVSGGPPVATDAEITALRQSERTPTLKNIEDQPQPPEPEQPKFTSSQQIADWAAQQAEPPKPKPNGKATGEPVPPKGWQSSDAGITQAGKIMGLPARAGETYPAWGKRLYAEYNRRLGR